MKLVFGYNDIIDICGVFYYLNLFYFIRYNVNLYRFLKICLVNMLFSLNSFYLRFRRFLFRKNFFWMCNFFLYMKFEDVYNKIEEIVDGKIYVIWFFIVIS